MVKIQREYGECVFCGYVGSVERHHVVPRSLRVRSNRTHTNLKYQQTSRIFKKGKINCPIEKVMMDLCHECHYKLHREFKKFIIKDWKKKNDLKKKGVNK